MSVLSFPIMTVLYRGRSMSRRNGRVVRTAVALFFVLTASLYLYAPLVRAQSSDFSASRLEQKLDGYIDSIRTVGFTFAALLATLGFLIRGISKMIPDTQYRSMANVWSTEMIITSAIITAGIILAPVLVEAVKDLFGG